MHQNYVLRLYVPVENLVFVHQTNRIKKVANDEGSCLLWQSCPARYNVIELPFRSQLKDDVDILFIWKKSVYFDDIGML